MNMITLVVPVFNMEQYLPRCMDALMKQTCKAFTIILIDDGSTDSSPAMCDRYAKEHPELIRVVHKKNGGLSSARNAGIEAASGKYIIFPDPDDWVEPDYVEQLLSLQERYQPDLVCLGHFIDYDDHSLPANEGQSFTQMTGADAQKALLMPPYMSGFAWNKLYQLDIIREHHLKFLDDVGTTEDLDFAFRYLQFCSSVCFAPETRVYHYYQRSGAATHSGFSQHKMYSIHTYEKIIEASAGRPDLVQAAREEICNTAMNLLWMYQNDRCKDVTAKKKMRQYLSENMGVYLNSIHYGTGRKIQAVLAHISPSLYCKLKNKVSKN